MGEPRESLCDRLPSVAEDVLSDLLHRAGARNALVRQLIQRPPWSLAFTDAAPLAIVATLGGRASIRLDHNSPASVRLADGDIAFITGRSGTRSPTTLPPHPR